MSDSPAMTQPYTVVLDLDDAYPGNDRMDLLSELKQQVPGLKVTLFAKHADHHFIVRGRWIY